MVRRAQRSEIVRRFASGDGVRDLARDFSCSPEDVHELLRRAGITVLSRAKIAQMRRAAARNMAAQGLRVMQIARALRVNKSCVRGYLNADHVPERGAVWSTEAGPFVIEMWQGGESAAAISRMVLARFGVYVSRNAIIGRMARQGVVGGAGSSDRWGRRRRADRSGGPSLPWLPKGVERVEVRL